MCPVSNLLFITISFTQLPQVNGGEKKVIDLGVGDRCETLFVHTKLYSPEDALTVQNIYIYI